MGALRLELARHCLQFVWCWLGWVQQHISTRGSRRRIATTLICECGCDWVYTRSYDISVYARDRQTVVVAISLRVVWRSEMGLWLSGRWHAMGRHYCIYRGSK